MGTTTPIKRSEELKPLSRDHHLGLLLCWKIRKGIDLKISPIRIAAYISFFYYSYLESHFREEELYVFPLVKKGDNKVKRALDEHREIEKFIKLIRNMLTDYKYLIRFEQMLDDHIRYEERVLFPYIESTSKNNSLIETGRIIADLHNNTTPLKWEDEFWIK